MFSQSLGVLSIERGMIDTVSENPKHQTSESISKTKAFAK